MTPEAENALLKAENAALREQLTVLLCWRAHELEGRLAKDSHNSGKPPSSDGLTRKTRSLRRRRGKKPGGQLSHRGETLRLVATPDAVVEHRPATCAECQRPLTDEALVVAGERRQVRELPPQQLVVREEQMLHVRCPACQASPLARFRPKRRARRSMARGCGRWSSTWSSSNSCRMAGCGTCSPTSATRGCHRARWCRGSSRARQHWSLSRRNSRRRSARPCASAPS